MEQFFKIFFSKTIWYKIWLMCPQKFRWFLKWRRLAFLLGRGFFRGISFSVSSDVEYCVFFGSCICSKNTSIWNWHITVKSCHIEWSRLKFQGFWEHCFLFMIFLRAYKYNSIRILQSEMQNQSILDVYFFLILKLNISFHIYLQTMKHKKMIFCFTQM